MQYRQFGSAESGMKRCNVLGVGVHAVGFAQAVKAFCEGLRCGASGYVCLTSVHPVIEARLDDSFRIILNSSFLTLPDGMPLVWVGRSQGFSNMERVYGPDFMLAVCGESVRNGWTHFLYGGKPGVAEELKNALEMKYPGIKIRGVYCPPFRNLTQAEENELRRMMAEVSPDILWVGISSPKQERFMASHCGILKCRFMVGVGAAFDLHTGRMKDAPAWMKQAGLQWLHRLAQEPRRLGRRYLFTHPLFVFLLLLQLTGLKKFPIQNQGG